MPPAAISHSVVAGSVSSTGRMIDHAAPADRQVEDDGQPVEAAGEEAA